MKVIFIINQSIYLSIYIADLKSMKGLEDNMIQI